MNIRWKVVSMLALLFVVLSGVEIVIQQRVLMPSFAALERADAQTSMRRVRFALDRTLDALQLDAADWGNWVDTYRFVEDHDAQFVSVNITPAAMRQLGLDTLMIVDNSGKIVTNSATVMPTGLRLDDMLAGGDALQADFPWRSRLGTLTPTSGYLRTNLGVIMLAGAPILNGYGAGAPRGMVIMGRLLTPARLQSIGSQTQVALSMLDDLVPVVGDRILETKEQTQVDGLFKDVYGRPLMTLRVEVPRTITAFGRKAIVYASWCVVGFAIIGLMLLLWLLDRVILDPLTRITRHAVAIGADPELSARLNFSTGDEFGRLAREFDHMVDQVAESRRQLVDQSFHAGFAELAKGVLHNLGNAMTPLGVRLAALESRLRGAPVADLELAAGELARDGLDPERRADLLEFVRLGSAEVAAAMAAAEQDLIVMRRQTTVVQSALTEQMRSTHNEHVVEPVKLPELVAQSLEIVPDASRQRLIVDADDSLRSVGVVRVARTVLRLILQNLIINAADAVRDAGKERGVLRVAAEIVRDSGREQLHLHCQDDGVGIARDQLDRLFEKGYSTKSRDTNYGIGLHWCANAIASLGGRIWAASDGPGFGASLHLMLPLSVRETGEATHGG